MFKKLALLLVLTLSISNAFAQRIEVESGDTTTPQPNPVHSGESNVSIGVDVGYLTFAGLLPLVVDYDFADNFSGELAVGPTVNNGLVALALSEMFPATDRSTNYLLGMGGYIRGKGYFLARDERVGRWAPYIAMGYEHTLWRQEKYRGDERTPYVEGWSTLSAAQLLVGIRKEKQSSWFIDFTLGISRARSESQETYFPSEDIVSIEFYRTIPAANIVIGAYLD